MADPGVLIRLFSWLSPSFPIGGFAYSQGLETAIADNRVRNAETLSAWIKGNLHGGTLQTDAYFLAIAARAVGNSDAQALNAANDYALALQFSAERHQETREQARSFLEAASAWPVEVPEWLSQCLADSLALPIALGAMARLHGVPIEATVAGFANATLVQQVSVGVRLIPLGQSAGLAVQAALEPQIASLARDALTAGIDDIASLSYGTDIASLEHEDLNVRIFRS